MHRLTRTDILSLEQYAEQRSMLREKVIAHKKVRRVLLGPHATLHFEDRETMSYQIQEMLRVERIFEAAAIQEEIDTYNELIPDGTNWKATLLLEYEDAVERERELTKLVGIEERIFVKVGNGERIKAHANDDMPRSSESKTAAVHFLRFEFISTEIDAMREGKPVTIEIDHHLLPYRVVLTPDLQASLVVDFER